MAHIYIAQKKRLESISARTKRYTGCVLAIQATGLRKAME